MTAKSTASDSFSTPTWWGTQRDLDRLVKILNELQVTGAAEANGRLKDELARIHAEDDERIRRYADQTARSIADRGADAGRFAQPEALLEEVRVHRLLTTEVHPETQRVVENMELKMTVGNKTWNEEVTGSPEQILDELHPSETVKLRLEFGRSWTEEDPYLSLSMGPSGCQVLLKGPRQWVSAAAGQVKAELKKHNSRLSFVYHPAVLVLIGSLLGGSSAALLLAWAGGDTDMNGFTAGLIGSVIGAAVLVFGIPKVIPVFEVIPEGSKAKGKRAIHWLIAAAITIILGLIVNLLSQEWIPAKPS